MIELTLADGRAIDFPSSSVTMFEAMHRGKNEAFPDARTFVRYSLGPIDRTALVTDGFDDLVRLLDLNVRPAGWVLLTREDGDRVAIQAQRILGREAVADGVGACKLTISFGMAAEVGELTVRETRDEVKAQTDLALAPPIPATPDDRCDTLVIDPPAPVASKAPRRRRTTKE